MNKLPNPSEFKSFVINTDFNDISTLGNIKEIDLNAMYKKFMHTKSEQDDKSLNNDDEVNTWQMMYSNIFCLKLLRSFRTDSVSILKKHIGYSTKYKSLTISVFDQNNIVKCIAIQNATTNDGNFVKYKSYGSKKYISSKIFDDYIFFAVGMKELVLFELLNVSYIHLQSDSMVKHIPNQLIEQAIGRNIIIFQENDESFKNIVPTLKKIFFESNVFVIDFEMMLDRTLAKGFDFVDYCNLIADIDEIEKNLDYELEKQTNRGRI